MLLFRLEEVFKLNLNIAFYCNINFEKTRKISLIKFYEPLEKLLNTYLLFVLSIFFCKFPRYELRSKVVLHIEYINHFKPVCYEKILFTTHPCFIPHVFMYSKGK